MKKIILEVGVNTGTDTQRLLDTYSDCDYYGFEPTGELYTELVKKFADNPRVHFLPLAVSNYNGFATFHVNGVFGWGCSSLYNFSENINQIWPGRSDFVMTHSYRVPVIMMKSFLTTYITEPFEIEYAWIDAQGSDLLVLEGFGDLISTLKAGRIEVAVTTELYEGTVNTLANALRFFQNNNYQTNTVPAGDGQEADIDFVRIGE